MYRRNTASELGEGPNYYTDPVRETGPPIEVPLGKRKKQHDIDDFEVIDDLPKDAKHKIDLVQYFAFKRKKPLKCLMTREIARYFDRETYLKVSLKELILFIGFLVILCIVSFSTASPTMFYYSKVMSRLFVSTKFVTVTNQELTFSEINSLSHIWPYIENVALNNFYWEFWYTRYDHASNMEAEDESTILYENKLIGVPRLRQLRVRNDSCEVLEEFQFKFKACYDRYSGSTEDTKPFGLMDDTPPWTFTEDTGSHRYSTNIATYGGGGYYFDLNTTYDLSKRGIQLLKDNIWLDRGTRALFIDFTTYNANVNLFCIVKLIFEIPPTGGVLPSFEFYTQKLIMYVDTWDYIVLGLECLFVLFFIFYTIEELYEMTYFKWYYIKSFWNWIDLIILLLCYSLIALQIYRHVIITNTLDDLVEMKDSHPVFDDLNNGQTMFNIVLSILIFLSWLKLLKYLSINHSMYQMQTTIKRASSDLICFAVIFFTMFTAFVLYGYMKFGTEIEEFSTISEAAFALMRTVVGDFNYEAIERADHVFGPIYFLLYIYFIFFILVNMFLAIIIDAYSEVRSEINSGGIKTHVTDLISKYFNKFLRKIGFKNLAASREKKAEEYFARSTYQDIRNILRRCGFTELEMDLFFAKYEITEDRLVSPEEMSKILYSLEGLPVKDEEGDTIPEPLRLTTDQMTERITTIEEAVTTAHTKIDIILNKLEAIEHAQAARRREEISDTRRSQPKNVRMTSQENDFDFIDDSREGRTIPPKDKKQRKPIKFLITREISRFFDRETFLKTSLKEMLIYMGFLITIVVLTNSDTTSVQYFYKNALVGIFVNSKFNSMTGENINFREISSLDHIWPYLEDVLIENLFWSYWYLMGYQDSSDILAEESFVIYTNKLIGLPRIRQQFRMIQRRLAWPCARMTCKIVKRSTYFVSVRVRNDSCDIPDDFKLMFTACYAEYSSSTEDKSDFGPANSTAWTFTEPSILKSHKYTGEISTYGGGGYYVDIGLTKLESLNIIKELKHNLWLDRASRVLIIDFTTYNGNVNYFSFVKLIFELPPTGGVLSYYEIETQRFTWHFNVWKVIEIIFQIIFVLYFILFLIQEIYEIIYLKWHFIRSFWNWLDITIIVLCVTVIGCYLSRHFTIGSNLVTLIETRNSHAVFDDLLSIQYGYMTSLALLVFLSHIKFIKYLAFNHSMYQMQSTLSRASADILCFSVIFFTVFIAFAQLGHLLFGSQVRDFRTFGKSIFALLRTVVGDFDYQAIESANHLLGPIFFFSYIFFIFFILVNMFLAIIIDTYSEVRSDLHSAGIKTHMGDVVGRYFNTFLRKIRLKKLADSREQTAEIELARTTYQEIRNLLRRCGFTEIDIDLFFEKYEITEDRLISPDEMRKILSKVEDVPEQEGDPRLSIAMQDYEATNLKISERINILEDAAIGANNKIDIILNKLDGLLQVRMARRQST